jgi:predicted outer membrane protein
MKKYVALAAFMAVATPAMAQTAPPAAPMMAPMSSAQFRQMAMISDSFEIESSRLALDRSRNPRIRNFAEMMVSDHRQTMAALSGGTGMAGGTLGGAATGAIVGGVVGGPVGAAVGAGVGATAGATAGATTGTARYSAGPMLDARHADMLNQLAAARGSQFDRLYAQMQVMAHQEAVGMYAAYAQAGPDPALRNFAAQVLPSLEEHFAMAQRLPGARAARR